MELKEKVWLEYLALGLKIPFATLITHVCGFKTQFLAVQLQLPVHVHLWEAAANGFCKWVTVLCLGNLEIDPSSWLQLHPVLGISNIWRSKLATGKHLWHSECVSLSPNTWLWLMWTFEHFRIEKVDNALFVTLSLCLLIFFKKRNWKINMNWHSCVNTQKFTHMLC